MRAMRAREVTPEEAPELHGVIDRLCALADMPKPRVGVADTPVPNAFATGRSPERSVVCVTTGILGLLTAEELEGVLAHELSHVAHRDVLVMTVASSAGIAAGVLTQGAQFGAFGFGRRPARQQQRRRLPIWLVVLGVSLVVYAVSFVLLRLLSRYRELAADRAGAYLTMRPDALAIALQKITGGINQIPQRDLRQVGAASALCIAPAISGVSLKTLTSTHPSLEQRLEQLARIQAELSRPSASDLTVGLWETITGRSQAQARQPRLAVPGAERGDHAADRGRADADRRRLGLLPGGHRSRVPPDPGRRRRAAARASRTPRRSRPAPTRSGSPGCRCTARRGPEGTAGLCTDLHAVNTTLESAGFGPGAALLADPVRGPLRAPRRSGLPLQEGHVLPVRPTGPQQRDNLLELQVRDTLQRGAARSSRSCPAGWRCGVPRASEVPRPPTSQTRR